MFNTFTEVGGVGTVGSRSEVQGVYTSKSSLSKSPMRRSDFQLTRRASDMTGGQSARIGATTSDAAADKES